MVVDSIQAESASITYSQGEKRRILLFAFLATLFDGIDLPIVLYYLSAISKEFHVDLSSVSLVIGGAQIAGVLGAITFGHISDRYGRRPALALAVLTFSLFSLLSAFSSSYEMFFGARILVGFGLGGEAGIAYALINETLIGPKARRGLASASLQAMFTVGAVLAAAIYFFGASFYGANGWRVVFGGLGMAAILCPIIAMFMPESKVWLADRKLKRATTGHRPPILRMFRKGLAGRIISATLMMTFAWEAMYAPATYAPTVWQSIYQMSATQVALISAAAAIVLGLGFIILGAISDRLGRRACFSNSAWLCSLMYGMFVLVAVNYHGEFKYLWIVVAYCIAQGSCAFMGISGSWLSELLPVDVRSSAFNFIYYVSRALGGGIAPVLVLRATRQLNLGFEFVIGFGALGAGLAAVLAYLLPAESPTVLGTTREIAA